MNRRSVAALLRLLLAAGAVWSGAAIGAAASERPAGGAVITALVSAVKRADVPAIRALLQKNPEAVNGREVDGTTPLQWAAYQDTVPTARLLIEKGAVAETADRYGVTPLSLACTNGSGAMIRLLLAAGANPDTALPEGETPLMTAARSGDVVAVTTLLDHGAKTTATEGWRGQDALMWAAGEGHLAVVRLLVEYGAAVDARSTDGYTALAFAARQNYLEVVRFLVAHGADVNATTKIGLGPLSIAIYNANWDVAGYLIANGADATADDAGSTPLHLAIQIRNPDVESPFDAGAVVPPSQLTSLDVIKALIEHGADVNARMTKAFPGLASPKETPLAGATPFWLAAKGADPTLMRLLKESGADPLLATKQNTTPLMAAAGVGYSQAISHGSESEALEAVMLAREFGGDVNAQNETGYTALHGAAIRGANSIVQYLVDNGIKVDAKDKSGRTAWTIAALGAGDSTQRRQLKTAELLQTLMVAR